VRSVDQMSMSMGLRVIACIVCCLAWLPHVAAQAAPAAPQSVETPLSAQGETVLPSESAPAAAPSAQPPSAAAPEAAQNAAPPAAAAPAAAPAATPPPAAVPTVAAQQGHDHERPPARAGEVEAGKLLLRLSLGLQAGLLGIGSELQLMHPSFASFDIGYAPWEQWALLLRVSSWLSFGSYVSQFIGAGASHMFLGNMFLSAALGVGLHEGSYPYFKYSFQGLAAQLDVGQEWSLSSAFNFAVGAHFEAATHWLGTSSATSVGAGLFVSASYR
jgi:hypothetical protein